MNGEGNEGGVGEGEERRMGGLWNGEGKTDEQEEGRRKK